MSKTRLTWGALAATFAAVVGFEAVGNAEHWPLLVKVFDGDWNIAKNVIYGVAGIGAAVCTFMFTQGDKK